MPEETVADRSSADGDLVARWIRKSVEDETATDADDADVEIVAGADAVRRAVSA